ncbi:WXG100 family type VII secretion target [Aquipuribacter nitratireducens]|uniref:WXG100 family type VII secretion target n=1 Tax=Aquipuribacter nitratireducens TaxID=650104 RepID=A0ABW0GPC2_9MICO
MANITVTYADMRDAASRLRAGQAELEGTLHRLRSLVEGLVAGGYVTDRSSKAFDAGHQEFSSGALQVVGGIEGMSAFLDVAAQTLEDADLQLAQQLGH